MARRPVEVVRRLEVFTDVDLAIDRGSRVVVLGLNGAGKTTLLRLLCGHGAARHRRGRCPGTGCGSATTRRSTRPSTSSGRCWRTCARRRRTSATPRCARVLGSFLFTGDDVDKPAGVLSGGEKTRLALATLVVSGANVLLLDEPTNNLDPASRDGGPRRAAHATAGAVVLVTHDEGAVDALAAGAGGAAARRRRGPLERGLPRSGRAGLILWRSSCRDRRDMTGVTLALA